MIGFFFLERVLHGFHVHEESHAVPSRYLILVGDGVHNFIDGVAIAASFAASPELGLATTLAVTVHEVPQEIADFSILIAGGYRFRTALLLNFLSGPDGHPGRAALLRARRRRRAPPGVVHDRDGGDVHLHRGVGPDPAGAPPSRRAGRRWSTCRSSAGS